MAKPLGRSLADFNLSKSKNIKLHPGEQKLLEACREGKIAKLNDGKRPDCPTLDNTVRASFVRFLALGGDKSAPVHEKGVYLQGAYIKSDKPDENDPDDKGELNLKGAHVIGNLRLEKCKFEDAPKLLGTQILDGSLSLAGSHTPGLNANGLICKGALHLTNKFCSEGKVDLQDARIGAFLDCRDANLDGKGHNALSMNFAIITGSALLKKLTAKGCVCLLNATIKGNLDCKEAKLFSADGEKNRGTLSLNMANIQGDVFLNDGFTANGCVSLTNAQIGGNFICSSAQLVGNGGNALTLDGASIKGLVSLDKNFTTKGSIHLVNAKIGEDLNFESANLDGNGGEALRASGVIIEHNLFFGQKFTAKGGIILLDAQIGGNLDCSSANFDCCNISVPIYDGYALLLNRANIKGDVFLDDGFAADGCVSLSGAHIGGKLMCIKAALNGKDDKEAFIANRMTVAGAFHFREIKPAVQNVSLNHAQVGTLADDEVSWGENLDLDGFTYNSIIDERGKSAESGTPRASLTSAKMRLDWLNKQSKAHRGDNPNNIDFRPQPWRQLIKVLREMGHMEDAREIAINLERHKYKIGLIGQTTPISSPSPNECMPVRYWLRRKFSCIYKTSVRILHRMYGEFIGYGYRPLRMVGWMVAVWWICAAFYWYTALDGVFAPTNPLVFHQPAYAECMPLKTREALFPASAPAPAPASKPPEDAERTRGHWYPCKKLADEYTTFSPLAYSLGLVLPVVDMQQEKDWAPMVDTPNPVWYKELFALDEKHFVRFVVWLEILFGWGASLLLVTTLSGLAKLRDDD